MKEACQFSSLQINKFLSKKEPVHISGLEKEQGTTAYYPRLGHVNAE